MLGPGSTLTQAGQHGQVTAWEEDTFRPTWPMSWYWPAIVSFPLPMQLQEVTKQQHQPRQSALHSQQQSQKSSTIVRISD